MTGPAMDIIPAPQACRQMVELFVDLRMQLYLRAADGGGLE